MDFPNIRRWILFFLWPLADLAAVWIGNPSQPALQSSGIIRSSPNWWSFRLSYVGDYVYRQRFHDEFRIAGCESTPTHIKLRTQAGMLTLNFRDRIDLYGILGASSLQVDQDITSNQQLSWGIGGKLIILHEGRFRVGLDVKYFQSNQYPQFLLCDHFAYNIVGDFYFSYHEIQTAMGVSYRTKYLSPYVNATYLISKLEPKPLTVLVRDPMSDMFIEPTLKSVEGNRRWGIALGATIIDQRKATLAVEWRAFNQNSVDVTGEVRF